MHLYLPKCICHLPKSAYRNTPQHIEYHRPLRLYQLFNAEQCQLRLCNRDSELCFENTGFTKLEFPISVTKIGDHAFARCQSLTNIELPANLKEIGSSAFSNCNGLTDITIPDRVTVIGADAFSACNGLKRVKVGNSVQIIGSNAFAQCWALESAQLPDSLVTLHGSAFEDCRELREVYLGASLREIYCTTFQGCEKLTKFALSKDNPALLVDQGVLYHAAPLTLLKMPEGFSGSYTVLPGTTGIETKAFYHTGVTEVDIPSTVTHIDSSAFSGARSLKRVDLSDGLVQIGDSAFSKTDITSLRIPSSVIKIGTYAFSECDALKTVIFAGSPPEIGYNAFSQISPTVTFPGRIAAWEGVRDEYGGDPQWVPDCTAGHSPKELPGADPDCTNTGLTAGSQCIFCRITLSAQKKIPALGHDFTDWVTIYEPSANQEGLAKRRCNTCGEIEEKKFTQQPPANDPPVTEPPVTEPPLTEPPITEPPITEPTVTTPTVTEPSITEPTVTEPTVMEPTVTDPSATEPESIPAAATPQTPQKPTKPWLGIGIIATIVLAGGGISFLLLKKKFRL